MLSKRSVLLVFALCLCLDNVSSFSLPDRLRPKRDVNRLDQEFFPHMSEQSEHGDLSPGDAGEVTQDWDSRHFQSASFHVPLERLSVKHFNHHHRKPNDKRKKVAPLDTIGSSFTSSQRGSKDQPEDYLDSFHT